MSPADILVPNCVLGKPAAFDLMLCHITANSNQFKKMKQE